VNPAEAPRPFLLDGKLRTDGIPFAVTKPYDGSIVGTAV
jgi:hypothetical protein